jgi:type IVB pilus formation R64 PilN family outer membrane protein
MDGKKTFVRGTATAVVLSLLTGSLTGCASAFLKPMDDEIERQRAYGQSYMDRVGGNPAAIRVNTSAHVSKADSLYIPTAKSGKVFDHALGRQLIQKTVSINRTFFSLQGVAERITMLTGVPVTIGTQKRSKGELAGTASAKGTSSLKVPTLPSFTSGDVAGGPINIMYEGPLSGFLDTVAARYGVSWKWTGKGIHFFNLDTRTFRIAAIPGVVATKNKVTNETGSDDDSGSGGGANESERSSKGGSSSEVEVTAKMSVWDGIEKAVKAMLSPNGQVVVTPATGTLTVTDTPEVLDRVAEFVDAQNDSMAKRVHLNVRVVSVELSDAHQYGINWNALYKSTAGYLGMAMDTVFDTPTNGTMLTLSVLPGSRGSRWEGTKAIINALSEQGNVSNLTSANITTLNNQAAPLQVGRQIAYLKSASTTLGDGQYSSNSLTPGTINTGFTMSVLPHVLDATQMMLQFSVDISSLVSMHEVQSGGSMIQTPEIDTRNFLQRVKLHDGDTLILSGFEQGIASSDRSGVGSAHFPLLGGGIHGAKSKQIIVILITASIGD